MASDSHEDASRNRTLIVGLGSYAYGREIGVVSAVRSFTRIKPYFIVPWWGDQSVPDLLRKHGFDCAQAPFGYLGRSRIRWTLVTLLYMPYLWFRVLSYYRQKKCTRVLVVDLLSFVNALPALLVVRYIFRGRFAFYLVDAAGRGFVWQVIGRLVNAVTTTVVVNANAVKRSLSGTGVDEAKVLVVYNGVDKTRLETGGTMDLRGASGWEADAFVVGYVGQVSLQKGVMDFLQACVLVSERQCTARFVLVGDLDGPAGLGNQVRGFIREVRWDGRFVFLGPVADIGAVYRALDCLVVPSRYEDPAPNVVVEGMTCSVPVVATRVGGIPELVIDNVTAFIVSKSCPDELAEAILSLGRNPNLRKVMGAAGRERAERKFELKVNARKIEDAVLNA